MPAVINHQKLHMASICYDTSPLRGELTVSPYGPPHCQKVGGHDPMTLMIEFALQRSRQNCIRCWDVCIYT